MPAILTPEMEEAVYQETPTCIPTMHQLKPLRVLKTGTEGQARNPGAIDLSCHENSHKGLLICAEPLHLIRLMMVAAPCIVLGSGSSCFLFVEYSLPMQA